MPSWNSEFIHGYGCGLFGDVDPYTVLQPVCAAMAITLHAVGQAPVDRLQVLVVERLLQQHCGDGVDELLVGDRAVLGDARCAFVSLSSSPPSPMIRCATAWRKQRVLFGIAHLELCEPRTPFFSSSPALARSGRPWHGRSAACRLRSPRNRAQHALLATAGAGPVARHERVVVRAHHQHVAQRGRLRVLPGAPSLYRPRYFCDVSGSRFRNAVPVS